MIFIIHKNINYDELIKLYPSQIAFTKKLEWPACK